MTRGAAVGGVVSAAAIAVACLSPTRQEEQHSLCDGACLEHALVEVVAGSDASHGTRLCLGTEIGQAAGFSLILTAAHCTDHGSLFVRSLSSGSTDAVAPVVSFVVHPRFMPDSPTSMYDFAVLRVAALRVVRSLPLASVDQMLHAKSGQLAYAERNSSGASLLALNQVEIVRSTRLSLGVRSTTLSPCHGWSGMPLVHLHAGGFEILGVISHGSVDCTGEVEVGAVGAALSEFISAVVQGRTPPLGAQSCEECDEDQESAHGPCVVAREHCLRDVECAQYLSTLVACETDECQRACLRRAASNAREQGLSRCLCAGTCAKPCKMMCEHTAERAN